MPRDVLPEAVHTWQSRRKDYIRFRAYYRGDHPAPFASIKFARTYRWIIQQARENLMPATVAAFTDNVAIAGWTNDSALDEATQQGVDRLAGLVHREAFKVGDAFTLTWKTRKGTDLATFQKAENIVPHVDPSDPNQLDYATRVWLDGEYARANVYYPDRVERYVSRLKLVSGIRDVPDKIIGWAPFAADGDAAVIPHEYGTVPVCWWKRDAEDQFGFGRSILTDAVACQDELNYQVCTAIISSERIALPIRYALADVAPPATQSGTVFDPTKESILALVAKQVGEFPAPAAADLVALQTAAEGKIARTVGIPPYVFSQQSKDVPSGEALRILNERRTSIIRNFERDAGPVWRGQMALLGFPDTDPVWEDPMPVSTQEKADLATTDKALGLPPDVWLRSRGLDPDAVDAQGVTLRDRIAQTAQALGAAFANGTVPPGLG